MVAKPRVTANGKSAGFPYLFARRSHGFEGQENSANCDVFIGWSEDVSKEIAEALKDSIFDFFVDKQNIRVFVSTQDIGSGTEWYLELCQALRNCRIGIVVLTAENLGNPWIHYEAGAMAIGDNEKRVVPLLAGVELPEKSPMHWLECEKLDSVGYKKLLLGVNAALGGILKSRRVKEKAGRAFDAMVNQLGSAARNAVQGCSETKGTGLVYVGAPMASIPTDEEYGEFRKEMLMVVAALRECVSDWVEFAGEHVDDRRSLEGTVSASKRDIRLMNEAEFVAVVYPSKLPSSALMEVGYALGRKKPTVVFVRNSRDLPFLAKGMQSWSSHVRVYEYKTTDELVSMIKSNGRSLFQ